MCTIYRTIQRERGIRIRMSKSDHICDVREKVGNLNAPLPGVLGSLNSTILRIDANGTNPSGAFKQVLDTLSIS